jgi:lysozyme family protein
MNDFEQAIELLLAIEGGYVNDPDDPGGETKYGISKRSYPHLDIENLTVEEAKAIYHRDFWTPIAAVVNEPRLRILAFDTAVHSGVQTALSWLDRHETFESYLAYRLWFLTNLATWPKHGRGWTRRMGKILRATAPDLGNELREVAVLVDHRPFFARLAAAFAGKSGPIAYRDRPRTAGLGRKVDVRSPG